LRIDDLNVGIPKGVETLSPVKTEKPNHNITEQFDQFLRIELDRTSREDKPVRGHLPTVLPNITPQFVSELRILRKPRSDELVRVLLSTCHLSSQREHRKDVMFEPRLFIVALAADRNLRQMSPILDKEEFTSNDVVCFNGAFGHAAIRTRFAYVLLLAMDGAILSCLIRDFNNWKKFEKMCERAFAVGTYSEQMKSR
jgi:hypothetical protein